MRRFNGSTMQRSGWPGRWHLPIDGKIRLTADGAKAVPH
jgi:hypothetical protein